VFKRTFGARVGEGVRVGMGVLVGMELERKFWLGELVRLFVAEGGD
jgi:hypothetical protein